MKRHILQTLMCAVIIGLIHFMSSRDVMAKKMTHTIGGSQMSWLNSRRAVVDVDIFAQPGWIQPVQVSPRQDLSVGVLYGLKRLLGGRGGIWSSPNLPPEVLQSFIDDSRETGLIQAFSEPITIYIDLGLKFGVNRVMLRVAPLEPEDIGEAFFLPEQIEVGVNNGDPRNVDGRGFPILMPVWSGNLGGKVYQMVTFPTQTVRYVGITVSQTEVFRLYEVMIYGEGFIPMASFISKVIPLGEFVAFGNIRWSGERPPGTNVLIRTRTGNDDTPDIYWRKIPGTDRETNISEGTGEPLTWYDYYTSLKVDERGSITPDRKRWSLWSAPYDFEAGLTGTPIISPPGSYIQFRVDFEGTFTEQGRIHSLSFDYSYPVAAHWIVGEISPTDVQPARVVTFTYAVRPRITGKDTGFDRLEIFTPVKAQKIHSVRIDRVLVPFEVEFKESPTRFVVHFPKMGLRDDNGLLEVEFDCSVLRYGTAFLGRVYDSQADQYPQLIIPGDAKPDFGRDEIMVQIDLEKPLIIDVAVVPNPFTPNGDGINDVARISYSLLKLVEVAPVVVDIYDLSGFLVRRVYGGEDGGGIYVREWDGRDDGGYLLPPGIYLYRISVEADIGREERTGTVAVVY